VRAEEGLLSSESINVSFLKTRWLSIGADTAAHRRGNARRHFEMEREILNVDMSGMLFPYLKFLLRP
jgi:hypothetical protein